jgi:head-tail adaptor
MPKGDISIKAGTLRHLIHILRPTVGTPGTVGGTTNYVPYAQFVPAGIEPASARDSIRSGQVVSEVIVPITIRWMPGVFANGTYSQISGNYLVQWLQAFPGMGYIVTAQYIVTGVINADQRNWRITLACIGLGLNQ